MEMSKNQFNFYNATPFNFFFPFNFKIQGQGTVFSIMIKDLEHSVEPYCICLAQKECDKE